MSRTFEIYAHGVTHIIVIDTGKQLTVRDLIKKYGEKIGIKEPWIDLMSFDEPSPFVCNNVLEFGKLAERFLWGRTPIEDVVGNKFRVVCSSDW